MPLVPPRSRQADGTARKKPDYSDRRERLAINLFDLMRLSREVRLQLDVGKKLNLKEPIWMDKNRKDEHAVAFTCDLLTAAVVCDVVRARDRKEGRDVARVHLMRLKAWDRVPSWQTLTIVEDGVCVLNHGLFNAAWILEQPTGPPVQGPAIRVRERPKRV